MKRWLLNLVLTKFRRHARRLMREAALKARESRTLDKEKLFLMAARHWRDQSQFAQELLERVRRA